MVYKLSSLTAVLGINRNILECKYTCLRDCIQDGKVLIETYWNVNVSNSKNKVCSDRVLIETYWNVNKRLLTTQTEQL